VKDLGRLGTGFYFEELVVGATWRSPGRTLLEADLAAWMNLTWFNEELFSNKHDTADNALKGSPVPAAMVFAMAEGLIVPSMARTGLAFLNCDVDVKKPIQVGDTIYVHCEVIEARLTSKGDRGLVRTRNSVRNGEGEELIVYQPLRLFRCRPKAQQ
jgi:acyl dehydratase